MEILCGNADGRQGRFVHERGSRTMSLDVESLQLIYRLSCLTKNLSSWRQEIPALSPALRRD